MGRKVHWRHLTTQVAIMSLVFQAIMAALMLPIPSAMAEGARTVAPGTVIICTDTGYKVIAFDENGNQIEKRTPSKPCPICDGIATSAFLLEMAPTALIGRLTNPQVLRPANELRPGSIACLAHRSRGPPALA
jgi:hypothetical protein